MDIEFRSFAKIKHFDNLEVSITQKIHGTNAQIYIFETENGIDLLCGSRTRWLKPGDDNYGFASFVHKNKEEFIQKLGVGRHYGEWAGPGINSGEGLKVKQLFLFDWRKFWDIDLPDNVSAVPVLTPISNLFIISIEEKVRNSMDFLKKNGSLICPGYMKPEGIVIEIDGVFYKKVFDNQEIAWKMTEKKPRIAPDMVDVSHLLQTLRLEKLLSKDERYVKDYPKSLPLIFSDYVKDLEEEQQIIGNEDEVKAIKKALGKKLFIFVKQYFATKI